MIMKKLLVSLLAVIALSGAATAQTLSIADVEALPGETVAFGLTVNVQGGVYSGFQFQMQFPAEGFTTKGTTVSSGWDGASFGVGDLVAGIANGSAYSSSDAPIPDGEQEIATVKFAVASTLATGDYDVTISGFNLLDGSNYTPVSDVTFKVHVVSAHSVTLDENSTSVPEAADGVNVIVKRTINAKEWSTICLPFDMTATQVTNAFGDGVLLGDFTGCDATCDTEDNVVGLTVHFVLATAIEANHPYIIKVQTPVTYDNGFRVNGVDIAPTDELSVDKDEYEYTYKVGNKTYKGYLYNSFVGTYVANTEVPENSLFLSGNQFWYSTGATKMKAFRGYFDFYDVLTEVVGADARITMSFGDETTDITDSQIVNHHIGNRQYFDLQGRRVQNPGKGLYLYQGKKVIINNK